MAWHGKQGNERLAIGWKETEVEKSGNARKQHSIRTKILSRAVERSFSLLASCFSLLSSLLSSLFAAYCLLPTACCSARPTSWLPAFLCSKLGPCNRLSLRRSINVALIHIGGTWTRRVVLTQVPVNDWVATSL